MMRIEVVGITGGVGAGKSEVLSLIREMVSCRIIYADDLAKELQEPGRECFDRIVGLLGKDVLSADGRIDTKVMSTKIYRDPSLRKEVNAIVHPAVEREIRRIISDEKEQNRFEYLFIEAALLIECGYDRICDELWYIYASEEERRRRLKASRGYSDEKIDGIFASQLSEAEFRAACTETIINEGEIGQTRLQLKEIILKRGRQ